MSLDFVPARGIAVTRVRHRYEDALYVADAFDSRVRAHKHIAPHGSDALYELNV